MNTKRKHEKLNLYAPEIFWKLLVNDQKKLKTIANGCGAAGWKFDVIPDTMYLLDVSICCDIHDVMYYIGKEEKDREIADRTFLNNLNRMINAKSCNKFIRWLRRRRAIKYFYFVNKYGGSAFWDDKNDESTFKEIIT